MNDERPAPAEAPETAAAANSCRVCGADARSNSAVCDACAEPTGAGDTNPDGPFPPIPDGGLDKSMPAWLRHPPHSTDDDHPEVPPATARLDISAILTDDDLPDWLKRIAERRQSGQPSTAASPSDGQLHRAKATPESLTLESSVETAPQPIPAGIGSSLPPLPSSLVRSAPPPSGYRPAPPGDVKERLVAAAMAIVAIILLVLIFLL